MTVTKQILASAMLLVVSFSTTNVMADNTRVPVATFSKGDLQGWDPKSFSGKTQYQLVQEGTQKVLKADSRKAASGLGKRIKIDLTKTPVMNWMWRIDGKLDGLNEQSKAGDDYAARVYVIVDGGILPWNTKALNYVWSSNQPRGAVWNNAFLPKNAKMTAVRGTQDKVGSWVREKRNVRADFKQIFGRDITEIDGVAIMTDTDNSQSSVGAAYGDIFFTAQ